MSSGEDRHEIGSTGVLGSGWTGGPPVSLGQGRDTLSTATAGETLSLSPSLPLPLSDLQYYSECHGVIYVIDSCDPENLAISAQTFSECETSCLQSPGYQYLCASSPLDTNLSLLPNPQSLFDPTCVCVCVCGLGSGFD